MKEIGYIDNIEEDIISIEVNNKIRTFHINSCLNVVSIGDVVYIENGKVKSNKYLTEIRKNEIEKLMDELFE